MIEEVRHYMDGGFDAETRVQHILIETERLYADVGIEDYPDGSIDLKRMAEEKAKHLLLEKIKDYIKTDVVEGFNHKEAIRGIIYLPYIYDDVINRVNDEKARLKDENSRLRLSIAARQARIEWLVLPWYKKLWSWLNEQSK